MQAASRANLSEAASAITKALGNASQGQRRGAMLALAVSTGYGLLRFRLLPTVVMRTWFTLTVLLTIFPTSALLYLIDPIRYLGVPSYYSHRICVFVMCVAFKVCCALNPHIHRHIEFDADGTVEGAPRSWSDIPRNGIAFVLNHCSFWDVFELINAMPMRHLLNTRTLMKSTLRQIPIFGGCFDRVGHFPVYFKSDEDGNFQVDKEKQAAVQVKVEEHLSTGGILAVFPEGAMNKNPEALQTFRFGTFSTIVEHKMPLYYMVMTNNEKTWPRTAGVGGYPADIYACVGTYPVNYDHKDSKELAREMQVFMQHKRDGLVEKEKKAIEASGRGHSHAKLKPAPAAAAAPATA